MSPHSFFYFSGEITPERVRLIHDAVCSSQSPGTLVPGQRCRIYLTGEAIISLVDRRNKGYWDAILQDSCAEVIADGEEIRLHGLAEHISRHFSGLSIPGDERSMEDLSFWNSLVADLNEGNPECRRAGFLLCQGPYMSRTPVYMLRFLKSAVEQGIQPELYAYLDGVHAAHLDQRPSEFENIGEGIAVLATIAGEVEGEGWFGACSWCATARGYFVKDPDTGACRPSSCIPAIRVRPLKEILERFMGAHPILAECCGGTLPAGVSVQDPSPPVLNILISSSPYASEWSFGGLSMAVATAMGGIETRVLFLEQGVYALCGTHDVQPEDRVFNVQEMIESTMDIPMLHYGVYAPSLEERGISPAEIFSEMKRVYREEISHFFFGLPGRHNSQQSRMIFF